MRTRGPIRLKSFKSTFTFPFLSLTPCSLRHPPRSLPGLEVVDGLLHALLVVADHVLVHVGVVGANVLLRAAVWHRAETQRRVLLRRVLELHEKKRWAEIKAPEGS